MPKGQLVSRLPPNPGHAAGERPHTSWPTALPPELRPVVIKPAAPPTVAVDQDSPVTVSLVPTTTELTANLFNPELKGQLAMPQSTLYLTQVPGSPGSDACSKTGSPRRTHSTTAQPVLVATEVVASIHQLAELRVSEGATARPRALYGNDRVRYSHIRVHPQHEPFRSPREQRTPRTPRTQGQHPHAFPASSPRSSSPRKPQAAPIGPQPQTEVQQFLAMVRGHREMPTPWQLEGKRPDGSLSVSQRLAPV